MNITVSLSNTLVDGVVSDLRVPISDNTRQGLERLAEQLLWQARVVLAASIAEATSEAPTPKKRRGRPRKATAPVAGEANAQPKRRGRPRKVQAAPVEPAPAEPELATV